MAIPAQLINDVVTITGRADLTNSLIPTAIQQATLKEHAADNYDRDLTSAVIPTNTDDLKFSLNMTSLTRPRRIQAVREPLILGAGEIILFDKLSSEDLFDYFGSEKTNYYLKAGSSLNITAARSVANIEILYYQYPDVYIDYQSWIADAYPYVIADHAASIVFKSIGKDDEAQRFRANAVENRLLIASGEI
jgi:hypothetical protein